MACEFFASVGLCKYGHQCSRAHTICIDATPIVILPNIAPFTTDDEFNKRMLKCSLQKVLEIALEYGRVLDFAIADNYNHLYGTAYL